MSPYIFAECKTSERDNERMRRDISLEVILYWKNRCFCYFLLAIRYCFAYTMNVDRFLLLLMLLHTNTYRMYQRWAPIRRKSCQEYPIRIRVQFKIEPKKNKLFENFNHFAVSWKKNQNKFVIGDEYKMLRKIHIDPHSPSLTYTLCAPPFDSALFYSQ